MSQEKGGMTLASIFRKRNQDFLVDLSKEYGQVFTNLDDVWAYTDSQMQKHNTCKKCGYMCRDYDHLERHSGNRECTRRQKVKASELANQEYKPEWKKKKWCDICKVSYSRYFKHDETESHKEKLDELLGKKFELKCTLCKKEFSKKIKFVRHLKESKICHRKIDTAEKYLLYAGMCEKLRVKWDPKIHVKTGQRRKTIHELSREEIKKVLKERETTSAKPPRPLPSSADREQCVPCPPTSSTDPELEDHCKVAKGTPPQPRVLEV